MKKGLLLVTLLFSSFLLTACDLFGGPKPGPAPDGNNDRPTDEGVFEEPKIEFAGAPAGFRVLSENGTAIELELVENKNMIDLSEIKLTYNKPGELIRRARRDDGHRDMEDKEELVKKLYPGTNRLILIAISDDEYSYQQQFEFIIEGPKRKISIGENQSHVVFINEDVRLDELNIILDGNEAKIHDWEFSIENSYITKLGINELIIDYEGTKLKLECFAIKRPEGGLDTIEVETDPIYYVGEKAHETRLIYTADGQEEVNVLIPTSSVSVDTKVPGEYRGKVYIGDSFIFFDYKVKEANTVDDLSFNRLYKLNDSFVNGRLGYNGREIEITKDMVTGLDLAKEGKQLATIKFEDTEIKEYVYVYNPLNKTIATPKEVAPTEAMALKGIGAMELLKRSDINKDNYLAELDKLIKNTIDTKPYLDKAKALGLDDSALEKIYSLFTGNLYFAEYDFNLRDIISYNSYKAYLGIFDCFTIDQLLMLATMKEELVDSDNPEEILNLINDPKLNELHNNKIELTKDVGKVREMLNALGAMLLDIESAYKNKVDNTSLDGYMLHKAHTRALDTLRVSNYKDILINYFEDRGKTTINYGAKGLKYAAAHQIVAKLYRENLDDYVDFMKSITLEEYKLCHKSRDINENERYVNLAYRYISKVIEKGNIDALIYEDSRHLVVSIMNAKENASYYDIPFDETRPEEWYPDSYYIVKKGMNLNEFLSNLNISLDEVRNSDRLESNLNTPGLHYFMIGTRHNLIPFYVYDNTSSIEAVARGSDLLIDTINYIYYDDGTKNAIRSIDGLDKGYYYSEADDLVSFKEMLNRSYFYIYLKNLNVYYRISLSNLDYTYHVDLKEYGGDNGLDYNILTLETAYGSYLLPIKYINCRRLIETKVYKDNYGSNCILPNSSFQLFVLFNRGYDIADYFVNYEDLKIDNGKADIVFTVKEVEIKYSVNILDEIEGSLPMAIDSLNLNVNNLEESFYSDYNRMIIVNKLGFMSHVTLRQMLSYYDTVYNNRNEVARASIESLGTDDYGKLRVKITIAINSENTISFEAKAEPILDDYYEELNLHTNRQAYHPYGLEVDSLDAYINMTDAELINLAKASLNNVPLMLEGYRYNIPYILDIFDYLDERAINYEIKVVREESHIDCMVYIDGIYTNFSYSIALRSFNRESYTDLLLKDGIGYTSLNDELNEADYEEVAKNNLKLVVWFKRVPVVLEGEELWRFINDNGYKLVMYSTVAQLHKDNDAVTSTALSSFNGSDPERLEAAVPADNIINGYKEYLGFTNYSKYLSTLNIVDTKATADKVIIKATLNADGKEIRLVHELNLITNKNDIYLKLGGEYPACVILPKGTKPTRSLLYSQIYLMYSGSYVFGVNKNDYVFEPEITYSSDEHNVYVTMNGQQLYNRYVYADNVKYQLKGIYFNDADYNGSTGEYILNEEDHTLDDIAVIKKHIGGARVFLRGAYLYLRSGDPLLEELINNENFNIKKNPDGETYFITYVNNFVPENIRIRWVNDKQIIKFTGLYVHLPKSTITLEEAKSYVIESFYNDNMGIRFGFEKNDHRVSYRVELSARDYLDYLLSKARLIEYEEYYVFELDGVLEGVCTLYKPTV